MGAGREINEIQKEENRKREKKKSDREKPLNGAARLSSLSLSLVVSILFLDAFQLILSTCSPAYKSARPLS
jgi:hypothetical protein